MCLLVVYEGNDNLHLLTAGKRYKLRVDLTFFDGSTGYAEFDNFKVASAADKYRLSSIGRYSGTAGKLNKTMAHILQKIYRDLKHGDIAPITV